MNEVLDDIKTNSVKNVYFFYGKEKYLVNFYIKRLFEYLLQDGTKDLNYEIFEEKNTNIDRIIESIETLPVFSEKKVVYLKNIGLFDKKSKNLVEKLVESMKNIPETTCLIIEEEKQEKVQHDFNGIFKNTTTTRVVNCEVQKEEILLKWIQKKLGEHEKTIDPKVAAYMLRKIGSDMNNIISEIDKLANYKVNEKNIVTKDIDEICIESMDSKIFDLLDFVGRKNVAGAMNIYANLIYMQEPVQRILYMVSKHFMSITDVKMLSEKGYNLDEISKLTGSPKFVVQECKRQAELFTNKDLKQLLKKCLETDLSIKKGMMDPNLAVELLILEGARK